MSTPTEEPELTELLEDLLHDLGKHIRLPLALLPADAPSGTVREALAAGLLRTRRGPLGTCSARELWQSFSTLARAPLARRPGWAELEAAVTRALNLEQYLHDPAPLPPRADLLRDLAGPAAAIRALLAEIEDEG